MESVWFDTDGRSPFDEESIDGGPLRERDVGLHGHLRRADEFDWFRNGFSSLEHHHNMRLDGFSHVGDHFLDGCSRRGAAINVEHVRAVVESGILNDDGVLLHNRPPFNLACRQTLASVFDAISSRG